MRKCLMILALMWVGVTSVSLPAQVMAETGDTEFAKGVCSDSNISAELKQQAGCKVEDGALSNTVVNLINVIIAIIGLLAVVVIVIGGIMYTTSLGDPGKMTQARNMIIYAVVALVVAVAAWAIVQAVVAATAQFGAGEAGLIKNIGEVGLKK